MFRIDKQTKQINLTRGDIATLVVNTQNQEGTPYIFKDGDVVRFKVFKAKDCSCIELQKDVLVNEEQSSVIIDLSSNDTRIGEVISKPTKYWYEIELNPEKSPQTIIGYDLEG